jgi:hypothetical protein
MSDRYADHLVAVRQEDLASAAAVVVRFRRRRRAVLAAALSLVAATAFSSQLLTSSTTNSLVPVDTVPTPGSYTPAPTATPSPAASPGEGGPDGEGSRAAGVGRSSGRLDRATDGDPGGPPHLARRWPPFRPALTARFYQASSAEKSCAAAVIGTTTDMCMHAFGTQSKDGSVVLGYRGCVSRPILSTAGYPELRFATTKEVDLAVTSGKRVVWQWSTGQTFPRKAHSVTVGGGTRNCYEWSTRWSGLLDDGTRLAPGSYGLQAAGFDTGHYLESAVTTVQLTR